LKYLDKPFAEGAYGPDAYDCVGLVWRILYDSGKNPPREWEQYNETNYFAPARGKKSTEMALLRQWIASLGEIKATHEMVAGDIILVAVDEKRQFPAIYCGNNHAIAAFRDRVRVFALNRYFKPVMVVRRG